MQGRLADPAMPHIRRSCYPQPEGCPTASTAFRGAQATEAKRACIGTGSRPAFEPMLMMAVPIPFFTCDDGTTVKIGRALRLGLV